MSYAIVSRVPIQMRLPAGQRSAIGAVSWDATSGCAGDCFGDNEVDSRGCCCPENSWNNRLYLGLRGEQTLRQMNELRVNIALDFMTEQAVGIFAIDNGQPTIGGELPLQAGLAEGLKRASANYQTIYPLSRWQKVDGASHEGECGPYAIWQDPHTQVGTPETTAAIENATGLKGQAANDQWWINIEPQVAQLLLSVPGGAGTEPLAEFIADPNATVTAGGGVVTSADSGGSHWVGAPTLDQIIKVDAGKVAPTDWTKAFLDLFAPGWQRPVLLSTVSRTLSTVPRASMVATIGKPQSLAEKRKALTTLRSTTGMRLSKYSALVGSGKTQQSTPQAGSSIVVPVMIGVGALAAAGAVSYLYYRRR